MDSQRVRADSAPKVRRVGFVTSSELGTATAAAASTASDAGKELEPKQILPSGRDGPSPVIIPPPLPNAEAKDNPPFGLPALLEVDRLAAGAQSDELRTTPPGASHLSEPPSPTMSIASGISNVSMGDTAPSATAIAPPAALLPLHTSQAAAATTFAAVTATPGDSNTRLHKSSKSALRSRINCNAEAWLLTYYHFGAANLPSIATGPLERRDSQPVVTPVGSLRSEPSSSRVHAIQEQPQTKSAVPADLPRTPIAKGKPEQQQDNAAEKPKTTRAERRAKQEAQRAAKAAAAGAEAPSGGTEKAAKPAPKVVEAPVSVAEEKKGAAKAATIPHKPSARMQFDDKKQAWLPSLLKRLSCPDQRAPLDQWSCFHIYRSRHLTMGMPQYDREALLSSLLEVGFASSQLHPAVTQLGLRFAEGLITGSNERCIAMLKTFRQVIEDYTTPSEKTLARDLTARFNAIIQFLIDCRPLSVGMGNAIKFLKLNIAGTPVSMSEADAKAHLIAEIDRYIQEKASILPAIVFANTVIVKHAVSKIIDGDVILTHGQSDVVQQLLLTAHSMGKQFRVVLVDSRPKLPGRQMLSSLLKAGLHCTYTNTTALSYIMREVTKVFLGAAAVLSNGTVIAGVGSAATAMVAEAYGKPVMICCETCKFHERVQLDSICSNELGDPEALVDTGSRRTLQVLKGWQDIPQLRLLNLTYDAMPASYVTMIVTEFGMIPVTSVPVILREYRTEPNL
eukprot:jgi/Chlat1/7397/Chrsp6S07425